MCRIAAFAVEFRFFFSVFRCVACLFKPSACSDTLNKTVFSALPWWVFIPPFSIHGSQIVEGFWPSFRTSLDPFSELGYRLCFCCSRLCIRSLRRFEDQGEALKSPTSLASLLQSVCRLTKDLLVWTSFWAQFAGRLVGRFTVASPSFGIESPLSTAAVNTEFTFLLLWSDCTAGPE